MDHKPVIGLVGGMGSGKTRVAQELARHGGRMISGDALGHEGLRQPEIRSQVIDRWGPEVLDSEGEVDRWILAAIVFTLSVERRVLEKLLHPWIASKIRQEIQVAQEDPSCRFVVLDAAVVLEAGWKHLCDRLIFVSAPRAVRLRRLADQRGWSTKEVIARENAQLSLTEKASHAHDAVENAGSLEELTPQVEGLLRQWGLWQ